MEATPPPAATPDWLGAGRPLDAGIRRRYEHRLGGSLRDVRVHADRSAAASAIALGAQAYAVGRDIAFGPGRYAPGTAAGEELLAHELAHVRRQVVDGPALDRLPMRDPELRQLDQELRAGQTPSQLTGEIGAAATKGGYMDAPTEDAASPISLWVYPRMSTPPSPSASASGASPTDAGSGGMSGGAVLPRATSVPPPERALIVGGVHGDERGPLQLTDEMKGELDRGLNRRDFDTFLIPRMNPWGAAHQSRTNAHGVDLNRNFPGLSGYPAARSPVPPEQPEVAAVRRVVEILRPARILALHGIDGNDKGGVFADPVEGPARELSARMATLMNPSARQGNRMEHGAFSARYPDAAAVNVTTAQSSLGSWGSAPMSVGGRATPVITHEVPGKQPLAAAGDRSVAALMPGLREFLSARGSAPSLADAALQGAVSDAFLTGEQATPDDLALLADIRAIVTGRFNDMAAYYRTVWRPANQAAVPGLPPSLSIVSGTRGFASQAGIMGAELARTLTATSTDAEVTAAIVAAMSTRSMPGFSRHHWGTDIDIVSATKTDWDPGGRFVGLIPFIRAEAGRFGFYNPFFAGSGSPPSGGFPQSSQPHYAEEPWHLSYAPLATVLQAEWARRIQGTVLAGVIARTAAAVHGRVPVANMQAVLTGIDLRSFQTNVAPAP